MNPQQALITDRVAIVTGSAEGIGNAIARCLANFGANVVLADINEAGAAQTAEEIRGSGRRSVDLRCDVTKQVDVDRMVARTLDEFGRVDILVNNVGSSLAKPFMEMTEEEWSAMLDLNLVQVFRCTKAVAKVMIDQGIEGSIINLTTIEAYRAAPGWAPYAAAKAGVVNFTRTMALELSPWGIRVNSIAPDATYTPGIARIGGAARLHGEAPRDKSGDGLSYVPLGRFGSPEDYGGAAIFLASDLSKWITGEEIHVDGGTNAAAGWTRTQSGHWTLGTGGLVYSGKPASMRRG